MKGLWSIFLGIQLVALLVVLSPAYFVWRRYGRAAGLAAGTASVVAALIACKLYVDSWERRRQERRREEERRRRA